MPNTRITSLTEDTTPADDDLLATVDISDTTQSAQGSTKKVQAQNLVVKKLRTSTGPAVLTVGAVADGEFLKRSGTSIVSAAAGGGGLGDVVGPGSATDNALARFDGTTGKTIQNSAVSIDDNGAITIPEIAAPGTPAAGKIVLYGKSDNKVYRKGEDGVEAELGGGGSGSPGGSSGDIQYNDGAGGFAGAPLVREDADTVALYDTSNTGANPSRLNVYGLKNGGNYERVGLGYDTGSSWYVVATEKAGTGSTRNIVFIVNGTPILHINSNGLISAWDSSARFSSQGGAANSPSYQLGGGSGTGFKGMYSPDTGDVGFSTSSTYRFRIADAGVMVGANDGFLFSSTALGSGVTSSVGIHRQATGVAEINDGTKGNSGAVLLRGRTVANLPGSPVAGMMATVTDSNTNVWGATIAGGGANVVLAFYNGSAWTVAAK